MCARFLFNWKRIFIVILAGIFLTVSVLFTAILVQKKFVYPLKYFEDITVAAKTYSLDMALILAVIKTESAFDESAVSKAGAKGVMQITEKTAEYIAKMKGDAEYDLFNATNNIDYGCYYLRYLINRFENLQTALCAYNAGEGRVSSWLKNAEYSKDGNTLKVIPFEETREYLNKIKKSFSKYKNLYGNILDK